MSKIIAIGDIHGRDVWKKMVNDTSFDVCIFIGDYFDSFYLDVDVQIQNFKDIIAFKKKSKKKVILLIGNHELHYILPDERYSGFNALRAADIKEVLNKNMSHLQIAYQYNDMIFSHAGVTKTWAKEMNLDLVNVADSINALPLYAFVFNVVGAISGSGDDIHQGCMWVRPASLQADAIEDYVQIVGHTDVGGITHYSDRIVLIDATDHGEYLLIGDEEITVKKVI